jgi:hypothetical protein
VTGRSSPDEADRVDQSFEAGLAGDGIEAGDTGEAGLGGVTGDGGVTGEATETGLTGVIGLGAVVGEGVTMLSLVTVKSSGTVAFTSSPGTVMLGTSTLVEPETRGMALAVVTAPAVTTPRLRAPAAPTAIQFFASMWVILPRVFRGPGGADP